MMKYVFDKNNKNYHDDPQHNLAFLKAQEYYYNNFHEAKQIGRYEKGYITLNEVLTGIGFEPEEAGVVLGWMFGPDRDNYIDFGIEQKEDGTIYLEFNTEFINWHYIVGSWDYIFGFPYKQTKTESENERLKKEIEDLKETIVRLAMIKAEML